MTPQERVSQLFDERRFREAVEPAREACREKPTSPNAWRCLSVALKHAGLWAECLDAALRAAALDPEDAAGPHWNAGIAATVLGDWPRARASWTACGVPVPDGDGPLEMEIGMAAVRIAPETEPEVVYVERVDPCRARIVSVPTPESGHRYLDLVLHDGEPRGKRQVGQRTITVFDELVLLEASGYGTWVAVVTCADPAARDAFATLFDGVDAMLEDWSESLEILCAKCSLGEPHEHAEPHVEPAWNPERRFAIAVSDEAVLERLRFRPEVLDVQRVL